MAETKSKFAGLFQKDSAAEPEIDAEPQGRTERVQLEARSELRREEAPVRSVGRPPGKRSDPAFKQYAFLLRRETHRAADAILRDRDDGEDMSGLMQTLLESWVKQQRPS
jgi:hypothetical protein